MAVYNLSGAGTIGLSSEVTRLFITVQTFGIGYARGRASPTNYYDIGLLRLGVQGAYYPAVPIDAADMVLDVPPGVTTLGYSLFAGANIQVTEVFNTYAPFPLGGVHVPGLYFSGTIPNDGASHGMVSYTVPGGRSALVEYADGRGGIANSTQTVAVAFLLNNQTLVYEQITGPLNQQTQGNYYEFISRSVGLRLNAGENIAFSASVSGSGGAMSFSATLIVLEYPQPVW